MKATIIGTGSYIPEYILTNQELSTMVETDDEWIVTRTGISERRIQKSGDVADMAVNAALKALDNAGINSEDIDLIIAATSTPDYLFPNCSSIIQKNTGAINAVCFDISAACSGFIMALSAAKAYIEAGMYKKVLIVCSEKMSGITDWKDRSTCILFGDGAGACVVESSEQEGVKSVDLHNEGMLGEVLTAKRNENIVMNGQEVFKFAVKKVPETINTLLKKENTESDENDVLMMVSQYASALQDILEWYNKEAAGTDIVYFNKLCDSAKEKCMEAERTTENALIEYSKRLGEI